ncbi:uncharacterized protein EI90DRAFT_3071064, partial [Cantharellus anzutake]|uniref:uncharacterized protein n=1 Tax=Cantharellus anzutake TaxID=1750568 RepID=UPI001903220F
MHHDDGLFQGRCVAAPGLHVLPKLLKEARMRNRGVPPSCPNPRSGIRHPAHAQV